MIWHNDDSRPLTPTEALHNARRACADAGLPDYTFFTEELIRWVQRGSMTAESAVAWIKVFSNQPHGPNWDI
jgi:hypothetical protein